MSRTGTGIRLVIGSAEPRTPRGGGPGRCRVVAVLLMLQLTAPARAQTVATETRIAVASNFAETITAIAERFAKRTGHNVTLIFGSTGKHFAQIRNGAPFDVLLAADVHRPELLEKGGDARPGSRFTYAVGSLVLWSSDSGYVDSSGDVLNSGEFRHLAIANPRLAPYGMAAKQALQTLGLWDRLSHRLVRGENISHAYNFVRSGNAELGFVALSQVLRPDGTIQGSCWRVPAHLYSPIEQQGVLLTDNTVARDFLSYLRSDEAREIIRSHGYETP